MFTFTTLIQHSTGGPSHSNQTQRGNKRHPDWKGGSKTVLICRQHDGVHTNPVGYSKKLLDLISEFGKVAGYKVNIQKWKEFLYTNNEISETEIRKKNPAWYSNKKNKVPMNKSNQGGKRPVPREIHNPEERN